MGLVTANQSALFQRSMAKLLINVFVSLAPRYNLSTFGLPR